MDVLVSNWKESGPDSLNSKEMNRLLWDKRVLSDLHFWFWETDLSKTHPWWKERFLEYQTRLRKEQISNWFS